MICRMHISLACMQMRSRDIHILRPSMPATKSSTKSSMVTWRMAALTCTKAEDRMCVFLPGPSKSARVEFGRAAQRRHLTGEWHHSVKGPSLAPYDRSPGELAPFLILFPAEPEQPICITWAPTWCICQVVLNSCTLMLNVTFSGVCPALKDRCGM